MAQLLGGLHRAFGTVDHSPVEKHILIGVGGPLHIGDGDLAIGIGLEGSVEFRRQQGLDVALALHLLLDPIHRVGDIHREDQFHVHRQAAAARKYRL